MGCIGLTRKEFMQLTPEEFNAICEQWNIWETGRNQIMWEQARFIAHCTVMPHTRKGISPTELIRFSWDPETTLSVPPATRVDFERIAERFGE